MRTKSLCSFILLLCSIFSCFSIQYQVDPSFTTHQIAHVFNFLSNNDEVLFQPGKYSLSSPLTLRNLRNITLGCDSETAGAEESLDTTKYATFSPSKSLLLLTNKFPLLVVDNSEEIFVSGLIFQDATHTGPSAHNDANTLFSGGAVRIHNSQSVFFSNTHFLNNIAIAGGAVAILDSLNIFFNLTRFIGNEVYVAQSALYYADKGDSIFVALDALDYMGTPTYVQYVDKSSAVGGAVAVLNSSNVEFDYFLMSDNKAGTGGALMSKNSYVTMRNGRINKSTAYFQGSAVYVDGGFVSISTVEFIANKCSGDFRCKMVSQSKYVELVQAADIAYWILLALDILFLSWPIIAIIRASIIICKQKKRVPTPEPPASELQQTQKGQEQALQPAEEQQQPKPRVSVLQVLRNILGALVHTVVPTAAESSAFQKQAPTAMQWLLMGFGLWNPPDWSLIYEIVGVVVLMVTMAAGISVAFLSTYKTKPLLDGMDISRNAVELSLWVGFLVSYYFVYPCVLMTIRRAIPFLKEYFNHPVTLSQMKTRLIAPLLLAVLLPSVVPIAGAVVIILSILTNVFEGIPLPAYFVMGICFIIMVYIYTFSGLSLATWFLCDYASFLIKEHNETVVDRLNTGRFNLKIAVADYFALKQKLDDINTAFVPAILSLFVILAFVIITTAVSILFGPFADAISTISMYKHVFFSSLFVIACGLFFVILARVSSQSLAFHKTLPLRVSRAALVDKVVNTDEMIMFILHLDTHHFAFNFFGIRIYFGTIVNSVIAVGTLFSVLQAFSNSYVTLFYASYQ